MSKFLLNVMKAYAGEIITGVIVGIISVLFTNLFYKFRLRRKQKTRFQDMIGEKIAASLLAIMDIEQEANIFEKYDIENRILDLNEDIKSFGEDVYYPAIMENWSTLCDYMSRLNNYRGEFEKYLSLRVAAYLWYGVEYLSSLLEFMRKNNVTNNVREMGTLFIFDVMNWREALEKAIVKDINTHSVKMVFHKGHKWEREKNKVRTQLEKKSVLFGTIRNTDQIASEMVHRLISEINNPEIKKS